MDEQRYLSEQLITYLGNKRALLDLIGKGMRLASHRLGKKKLVCLDAFSGSGIVARYLKQWASLLLANDCELYSEIINRCYLTNQSACDWDRVRQAAAWLRHEVATHLHGGYIAELYAPRRDDAIQLGERVFYTRRNAMIIDTARQAIDALEEPLRPLLLAPLLAEASVHVNTSGVFKGFYKDAEGRGAFGGRGGNALARILGEIAIREPVLSRFECSYEVYRRDIDSLLGELPELDVAYLDPPYNQHPYGSNYFMLNLIAEYRRPAAVSPVSGIPQDWNRSRYNVRPEAGDALDRLVSACPARFVLLSYNSEGFVPHTMLTDILKRYGSVTTFRTRHPAFRGSRNLYKRRAHVSEYVYVLEKN